VTKWLLDPTRLGFNTASLAGHSIPEAVTVGRRLGFHTIELLAFDGARHSQGPLAGFWFDRMNKREREELREVVAVFEHLTTHAPFIETPLFTHNPGIRSEVLRQQRLTIEATAWLGGSSTTMHINQQTGYALEEYWENIKATFRELGDHAQEHNLSVTIETGFPTQVDVFAGLIHEIDHPAVGANLDVGHLRGYYPVQRWREADGPELYNQTLQAQVRALGSRLYHVHLHDVRWEDLRDHRRIGHGIIDFGALFRVMAESGFEGLMTFELEDPEFETALAESKKLIEAALKA